MGKKLMRVIVILYIFLIAAKATVAFLEGNLVGYLEEANWHLFITAVGFLAIAEAVDEIYI